MAPDPVIHPSTVGPAIPRRGPLQSTAVHMPLIALKRRLIVNRMSTALLALSCPAIAGGDAGPACPVVIVFEILSACGGSRLTTPEALRDCQTLFALKPRLIVCRVSTALLLLSYPSIASGAANPLGHLACGGSRLTAPEALRDCLLEPLLFSCMVSRALS